MAEMSELQKLQEYLDKAISNRDLYIRTIAEVNQKLPQTLYEIEDKKDFINYLVNRGINRNDGTGDYEDYIGSKKELKELKNDVEWYREYLRTAPKDLEYEEEAIRRIQQQIQEEAAREARKQAALADDEQRTMAFIKACADEQTRLNNPECVIMKRGGYVQKRNRRIGRMK